MSEARSADPQRGGDSNELFAGTPYQAISRIGSGATSDVFLVEHKQLGARFAAKVLQSHAVDDERQIERLRIEAESLGALRHANIVTAVDFNRTADGHPFIVTEYLKGRTLDVELAERGAMPLKEALELTRQLLSALIAAHELGVVHRDIKPSNVFLCDSDGDNRLLKLFDFGSVRVLPGVSSDAVTPFEKRTTTGVVVGTLGYMSPEGVRGESVDARADIYSVALLLFYMTTGHRPTEEALLESVPPSRYVPLLPEAFDGSVLKGLKRNREERFQTAAEFLGAIVQLLESLAKSPELLDSRQFKLSNERGTNDDVAVGRLGNRLPKRLVYLIAFGVVVFAVVAALVLVVRGG